MKLGWCRAGLVCRRPWAQSQQCMDQAWLWAAVIPALRRWRQESQKCKDKFSYIKSSLGCMRSCLNSNQKKRGKWSQQDVSVNTDTQSLIRNQTWWKERSTPVSFHTSTCLPWHTCCVHHTCIKMCTINKSFIQIINYWSEGN